MVRFVPSAMSTNPNTKTYWRRVSRMARDLEFQLSFKYGDKSVTDIITKTDPKATRTMRCEAIRWQLRIAASRSAIARRRPSNTAKPVRYFKNSRSRHLSV